MVLNTENCYTRARYYYHQHFCLGSLNTPEWPCKPLYGPERLRVPPSAS